MAKLNLLEKADAYDRISKEVKNFFEGKQKMPNDVTKTLKYLFPQLDVENKDEMIRKWLIEYFNQYVIDGMPIVFSNSVSVKDIIAWLENQGESNHNIETPSEFKHSFLMNGKEVEVESEFKIGDWITFYGGTTFKIQKIKTDDHGILNYLLLNQNGVDCFYNKKYVDENARLWTIKDAKDGDVLQLGIVTVIFKEFAGSENCKSYCSVCNKNFEIPNQRETYGCRNATPATKEQREFLLKKMKEAGYKFDFKYKKFIDYENK